MVKSLLIKGFIIKHPVYLAIYLLLYTITLLLHTGMMLAVNQEALYITEKQQILIYFKMYLQQFKNLFLISNRKVCSLLRGMEWKGILK